MLYRNLPNMAPNGTGSNDRFAASQPRLDTVQQYDAARQSAPAQPYEPAPPRPALDASRFRTQPRQTAPSVDGMSQPAALQTSWYRAVQPRAEVAMQPRAVNPEPLRPATTWQRPEFTARQSRFTNAGSYGSQPAQQYSQYGDPAAQRPIGQQFAAVLDQPHFKKIRHRRAPLMAVFSLLIVGFVLYHNIHSSVPTAGKEVATTIENVAHTVTSTVTTTSAEREAAAREARMTAYKTSVDQIIAAHPSQNISVDSIDLSDNTLTSLGDSGTFTAASTAKLITAVTLLHQVEGGTRSLNARVGGTTASTLLQRMIVNSDNAAWESLNKYVTHTELVNYMTSLGWQKYDVNKNSLQPADMARLMQQLYEGNLINVEHKQLLLSLMQQANKQEYIVGSVKAAGPQYTVYHKAGWLDGEMHDVAIISDGKQTIVLAIYTYTKGAIGDSPATQQMYSQIVQAAMTAYFPVSASE